MIKSAPPTQTPPPAPPAPSDESHAPNANPAPDDKPAPPLPLMRRHHALFETARQHLEKHYGKAPPTEDLMRLWLASATPWDVARLFETAVLDLSGSDITPLPGDDYNQTLLAL